MAAVLDLGCGVYVLWLRLPEDKAITVGALGCRDFPTGYYAYVGSAQRGLWHRLHRHICLDKPLHWHIDYLRHYVEATAIMVLETDKQAECALADALAALPEGKIIVPGLGASDCSCHSHLFYFTELPPAFYMPNCLLPGLHQIPLSLFTT